MQAFLFLLFILFIFFIVVFLTFHIRKELRKEAERTRSFNEMKKANLIRRRQLQKLLEKSQRIKQANLPKKKY